MKVLFVTWDSGAVDYLASLFFPAFEALARQGVEVHTLQGSWGDDASIARVRAVANAHGLPYDALQFSAKGRRLRMPTYIARLAAATAGYAQREQIDVVMPRALIPAAAAVLARPFLRKQRIVWDADGLPADERVDFAGWSQQGLPYRALRQVERAILQVADRTMVRTENAKRILVERARAGFDPARIVVVPNGRDPALYAPAPALRASLREREGIAADAPLLISVGSLGPQYYPDVQAEIAARLLVEDPRAHAVFLTAQSELILDALARQNADLSRVIVRRVPAVEVPEWLAAADVALALREPAFSQQAVCPLKVGEYLLAGLPVIATLGVGDLDEQLADLPCLQVDVDGNWDSAPVIAWILSQLPVSPEAQAACREIGLQHFSLDAALAGYQRLLSASD